MKYFFTLLLFVVAASASAQDTLSFTRHYDNAAPSTGIDSLYFNIPNTIFILLCEGFDDSLHITVNGNTIMDGRFKTDASTGLTEGSFGISFSDSAEVKDMVIKFVKTKRLIKETLNLKYKLLEIGKYYDGWKLMYGNHWRMRE